MELLKNCFKIPEYGNQNLEITRILKALRLEKKNHISNMVALPAAGGLVLRDP